MLMVATMETTVTVILKMIEKNIQDENGGEDS